MDQALASGKQQGAEQRGDAAVEIDPDQALPLERRHLHREPADIGGRILHLAVEQDSPVLGDGRGPMDLLGHIDSYADAHVVSPLCWLRRRPLAGRQRPNQRSIAQSNKRSGKGGGMGGHAA